MPIRFCFRLPSGSYQPTDHALQRPVRHAHHVAFLDQRHRVVGQLALDQRADAVNLFLGDRRQDAVVADDLHDAVDLQDADALVGHEPREYVAGEQRPVDLLFAILPAAPLADSRQEHVDVALLR